MRNGTAVDGRDISGGLMLSKARLNLVPAGVYIDVDTGHKMLVFKLGSDFLSFEGEKWERSY